MKYMDSMYKISIPGRVIRHIKRNVAGGPVDVVLNFMAWSLIINCMSVPFLIVGMVMSGNNLTWVLTNWFKLCIILCIMLTFVGSEWVGIVAQGPHGRIGR